MRSQSPWNLYFCFACPLRLEASGLADGCLTSGCYVFVCYSAVVKTEHWQQREPFFVALVGENDRDISHGVEA